MKLSACSIKNWVDLEKLFLTRFFEDDTEVSLPILLATKQKKRVSIKMFVERVQSMALRCPSGMTQSTLVETCRHNLQTTLLSPNPDRSGRVSHLKAAGASRRTGGGDRRKG